MLSFKSRGVDGTTKLPRFAVLVWILLFVIVQKRFKYSHGKWVTKTVLELMFV